MPTLTIQTGNTDHKLRQQEWATYVLAIDVILGAYCSQRHFFGGPENWQPWQNVAWIVDVEPNDMEKLKEEIKIQREKAQQDSVAWTEGTTLFI